MVCKPSGYPTCRAEVWASSVQPCGTLVWRAELRRRASRHCVWIAHAKSGTLVQRTREVIVPSFSPELIRIMRAALDEVMTQMPLEQATPGVKAALAEYILKAAAQGQTSYEDLIAAAAGQIQTIFDAKVVHLRSVVITVGARGPSLTVDFTSRPSAGREGPVSPLVC